MQTKKQQMIAKLRYPLDLDTTVPSWLQIKIQTFEVYDANRLKDPSKINLTGTIGAIMALPIPGGLVDVAAAGWSDEKVTNALQTMANAASSNPLVRSLGSATSHFGEKHSILNFSGIGAKPWNLFWEFLPQTQAEADQVEAIIKQFRRAQLPKKGLDVMTLQTQQYPDMVVMKIVGNYKKSQKFLPCFITTLAVDRSWDGTHIEYDDGNVPSIRLTMQLLEITNYTKEIFDRLYGTGV